MQMVEFQKSHYITAKTFTGLGYTRNTASVLEEAGIAYSSPAPEFNPAFLLLIFWVFLVLSYYLPLRSELCDVRSDFQI